MKKNNPKVPNPKYYFPSDTEEVNMEGPSDTIEPQVTNTNANINNNNKNNMPSKDYSKYNLNNISNANYKFNESENFYGDINTSNKFKDDYIPKKKKSTNEDDELEAMLKQTQIKQKETKLKEKSIVMTSSNFQSSIDKSTHKKNNIDNNMNNIDINNDFSGTIKNDVPKNRYKDMSSSNISNSNSNSNTFNYLNNNNNNKSINNSNVINSNRTINNLNDISSNLDTVNINTKIELENTYRSNATDNIGSVNMSLSSTRYKVPPKRDHLTKEEIDENEKINFNNYADDIVESFFSKNNMDSPNFFFDLASEMQKGQRHINYKLKKMIEEDEINNAKLDKKKQEYIEKLEKIKKDNSSFETKINNLNELYCEKLSYISLISKNLYEYEKFHKNIDFSCKLFEYIDKLNETDNFAQLTLPESLTDTEKIIDEGTEIYLAFKEIYPTCKNTNGYENFVRNFETLENKIKSTIKYSISKYYGENNLEKLRHIFGITEIMRNDLITDLYVSFIVEDVMKLKEQREFMKKVQFKEEGISEDLFTLIFKQADDFHETLLVNSETQFGKEYSKIYILFPESQHKIVCSKMINSIIRYLTEFRTIFISEKDKNEETYVRIVQYIYPKTLNFNTQMRKIVEFTKTDLEGALEQETNIFLRTVEGIYMNKEKNLLDFFITSSYNNLINSIKKMKTDFSEVKKGKLKGDKLNAFILDYLNRLYDTIQSTNFSKLNDKTKKTISRYNILIKSKSEKQDLTETFCKEVFDSIQELLIEYCNMFKLILEESMKRNQNIIDKHFFILSKIDYYKSQFKQIFVSELKDFFKQVNFYDEVEDYIIKCIYQIDIQKDSAFSVLNSFISLEYNKVLNNIRYKDTYKKAKLEIERVNSEEGQKIVDYLRKIFDCVKTNWAYLEKYQNMLHLLFTNTTVEKMKDILRNSKINNEGVKTMKNDFDKIAGTFGEYTESIYFDDVNAMISLVEILLASDQEVNELVPKLEREGKIEIDLIKIVVKKRNTLKKSK